MISEGVRIRQVEREISSGGKDDTHFDINSFIYSSEERMEGMGVLT